MTQANVYDKLKELGLELPTADSRTLGYQVCPTILLAARQRYLAHRGCEYRNVVGDAHHLYCNVRPLTSVDQRCSRMETICQPKNRFGDDEFRRQ
ncbi:hypothetical protein P3T43_006440 [Paraburkholderia sp. GAS41]|jgi:hypothetical protein